MTSDYVAVLTVYEGSYYYWIALFVLDASDGSLYYSRQMAYGPEKVRGGGGETFSASGNG